jgi:hypothetical protein
MKLSKLLAFERLFLLESVLHAEKNLGSLPIRIHSRVPYAVRGDSQTLILHVVSQDDHI